MKIFTQISLFFLFITSSIASSDSSNCGIDMFEASFPSVRICPGECFDLGPDISGGVAPYTYSWSTGEFDSTITICPIELQTRYDLTITDSAGDSLDLTVYAVIAPSNTKPRPTITTPICVGETVYFNHPNVGWQPTYHWSGPNGFVTNERNFQIEDVNASQAGVYSIYLDYFGGCYTDTIDIEVVISDVGESNICENLNTCNFACGVFDFFELNGTTSDVLSTDLPSAEVCGNMGEDVNAVWLGFVAQEGDHIIKIKATSCEVGEGLRYGIYEDCSLSNLILCSETCSFDDFEINSSILNPGQEYYVYVDGCGSNVCSYKTSIDGTISSSLCNDYIPLSNITEWQISSGGFGGSSTFWRFYTGDSIVNGKAYRIIDSENGFTKTLIREDKQQRKVYVLKNGFEVLLYDFTLPVGGIYIDPVYNNLWFVDRIELVQSHIGPLRRFWFKSNTFGLQWFYDEGVGAVIIDFPAHVVISDPVYGRPQVYAGCTQVFGDEDGYNEIRSTLDSITVSICEGEEYNGYSQAGIYTDTSSTEGKCLDIVTLDLKIVASDLTLISMVICEGEEYLGYNTTGMYEVVFSNILGCDSIINLDLSVNAIDTSYIGFTVCQGEPVDIMGASVNDSLGIYYIVTQDTFGCDDFLIFEIDTIPTLQITIDTFICFGDSILIEELAFYEEGVYTYYTFDISTDCPIVETTLNLAVLELGEEGCLVNADEVSLGSLEVFPNPARSMITLSHVDIGTGIIRIYDSNSRIVLIQKYTGMQTQIDLSNQPNGIYTIVLTGNESRSMARVLVF